MTVTELRKALEQLELHGHGSLQVGFKECQCNDGHFYMADTSIDEAIVDVAEATYGDLIYEPLVVGKQFVRLA